MNAQQLKNAILQVAIEGRLVPQNPNDEPASVLLQRIRKEKERLVKEGKLKKKDLEENPISEEEKPFEIPESWEWVRLKDIVMFIGGYAYDSSSFISNTNNQVLRLGNVKNNNILLDVNPVFIDDKLALKTDKFRCKKNDILITMTGTRKKRDYFYSVLINSNQTNLFINQRVGCLRFIDDILSRWLIIVLKTETILSDVFQYETGTANQGNLGAENILKIKIPLPPLAEQRRIVAKIEELMPKVEEYGKAQEALDKLNAEVPEKLKKSILQEAIEGRLVLQDPNDEPASVLLDKIRKEKAQLVKEGKLKKKDLEEIPISEDEKPFEIPESWEWAKLSFITSLIDGEKREGKYVCLDAKFLRGKSSGDILSKGKFVRTGDNIILVDGENSGEVFSVPCDGYMGSTFKQLWISDKMFLPYVLCFIRYYKDILRNSKKGAAIPHLNKEIFNNLVVGIPPLAEQHRIVAKIEKLFKEIDKLKVK